ncbi:hypothetical protein ACFL3S_11565 [Gemmatimonadota bacterium]
MPRVFLPFYLACSVLVAGAGVGAQEGGDCDVPHFDVWNPVTLSNGSRISYFNNPTMLCAGGVTILADSAVVFEATNFTQLFGNVAFEDPDTRLTARQAQYFSQTRELRAWGNPELTDLSRGSVVQGDTMVLLRASESRPEERLTVTGRRPHATLYPARQPPSGTALSDSVAPGDTAAVPDSLAIQDSTKVRPPPDSATVLDPSAPRDSVLVAPDPSLRIGPDSSIVVERPDPPTVEPQDSVAVPLEGEPTPLPMGPDTTKAPYEVDAQRMVLEGSGFFRATGAVLIRRDSLEAVADSVEYDESAGTLFLSQEARLEMDTYDLAAEFIWLDVPGDELEGVRARGEAVLDGEEIRLLSPQIHLILTEGQLERLVAIRDPALDSLPEEELLLRQPHPVAREFGLGRFPLRPYAVAQDYLLWADSIEVLAPGEILEELWAIGQARGESMSRDSLNLEDTPPLIQRDWLEGDTIIATFAEATDSSGSTQDSLAVEEVGPEVPQGVRDPPEADSTESRYRIEKLVARASARSLYRMEPSDSTVVAEDGRLAVHYVVGDEITLSFSEGEVERMEVSGATRGVHLEPLPRRREGGVSGDTVSIGGREGGS